MFTCSLLLVSRLIHSRFTCRLVLALSCLSFCGITGIDKAVAQVAHFSGAGSYVAGGGSNIYSIALDAKGDVYYTSQNSLGSGSFLSAIFADSPNQSYMLNGFTFPTGLAVDSSGSLYIFDSGAGAIRKITATNGSIPETPSPVVSTVISGVTSQGYLSFDSQGDLYFTSSGSNAVKEIVSVNGAIPPSPTARTLGSGFNVPLGIAVDKSGNVYVCDALNNAIKEMMAVGGSIPATPSIVTIGSGFSTPADVVVDSVGNLFVSDYGHSLVKKIVAVNGTIPSSPVIENLGTYPATQALTLDTSGSLYVGYGGNNLGGNVFKVALASVSFPRTNVGARTSSIAMTFTFDSPGTLGTTAVLTQGVRGLDFADTGTGSCAANTAYSSGQSCTVNVKFAPRFAGPRNGAAVLYDLQGNAIAIGYVQGIGLAPQATFVPGTETEIPGTSFTNPHGIAVDGQGSLFVSTDNGIVKETNINGNYSQSTISSGLTGTNLIALDGAGNLYVADIEGEVLKETPTSTGYIESVVDRGIGFIYGVAVDGAGNLYVADAQYGRILKEIPSADGYTRTEIITGLSSAQAVAVDQDGNVYVGYAGGVVKEVAQQSTYVQSGAPFGVPYPNAVAVDGAGNVYITDSATYNVYKETPTASGYMQSTALSDLHKILGPWGLALDGSGSLYIAYLGGNSLVKADLSHPAALNFASAPVGSTSPDSPLSVTLANDGNVPLAIAVPSVGSNPAVSPDFTLNSGDPLDCPIVTTASTSPAILAPATSCSLRISYAPSDPGTVVGTLTLTDNNLNASGPAYSSQTITLNGTSVSPSFTISPSPSSVYVIQGGSSTSTITITPEAGFTVNADLAVSGLPEGVAAAFSQNPTGSSTVLTFTASSNAVPGTTTVTITGTFGSVTQTATIDLTVGATPDYYMTFSASPTYLSLAPGASGSAVLTTTVLHGFSSAITLSTCSAPITGASVTFNPSTISAPGNGTSTMTIIVSPNGAVASNGMTGSIPICLQASGTGTGQSMIFYLYVQKTPVITWPTPAAITYGTPLSATQLNATANVPGTFSYSPSAGSLLAAGTQQLTATFTPTDTANYTSAGATVSLTVNKATPAIAWPAPAPITYGTPLSVSQLNATSNVPGTFSYSPAAGTVLATGTRALTVAFTPGDTTNYTTATATVQLTVNKGTPALSWPAPAPITYGTKLTSTQLNATANAPGRFVYTPAAGTILPVGTNTLHVTFTPTDTADYNSASASVPLIVTSPDFSISASPASLSVKQGTKATSTITITPTGGFSSNVTLSASGLPKGVTVSFSPNPAKTSSTLTFSASNSANVTATSVTITAKSGSLTKTASISLTVTHR